MPSLADENVILNKKGDAPLVPEDMKSLLAQVPDWCVIQDDGMDKLVREFRFSDYLKVIDLAHKIGCMGEQVNHHPDMHVTWGKLTVTWWTHVTGGLNRNDFIMAARCDRVALLISAP